MVYKESLPDSHKALRFRCADGGRLRYETEGSGDPVVFIHGFGLDFAMWDPQWTSFSSRYRAIRYDLRGYGGSSLPEGPYSHVHDLSALIDFLGARPVHLVGLSLGGRVALRMAVQEPAAVRSLTLADPAMDGHAWSGYWLRRWRNMTEAAARGDVRGAKQLWRDHTLFAPARACPEAAAALSAMIDRYSGWHWSHADPGTTPEQPVVKLLSSISIPTQVLVGELDLPDFQQIAQRLATDMPNAALRVIAGSGHMSNLEAPQVFNELVLEHLQRN
ncbi:MAG TPA: alpha/beta hydrolase [Steroidobacteraceae bacterium]|nr:alpha/beta hydrolase [Steroidobacteraceae bacterium]